MSAQDILNAIINQDAEAASSAFESSIAEKLATAIETRQQEVAQKMFESQDDE